MSEPRIRGYCQHNWLDISKPCPECSDQQPSKTPTTDEDEALGPVTVLETCRAFEVGIKELRQKCFADDCDSVVASCNCMTKSPEVQHHKKGCKYRLIMERDTANAEVERLKFENEQWKIEISRRVKLVSERNALLANSKALAESLQIAIEENDGREVMGNEKGRLQAHTKLMEQFK